MTITLPLIAGPQTVLLAVAASIGLVLTEQLGSPRMTALYVEKSEVVLAPQPVASVTSTVSFSPVGSAGSAGINAARTASRLVAPPVTVESRMSTDLLSCAGPCIASDCLHGSKTKIPIDSRARPVLAIVVNS